jgi:histidinol phosphatase-like enzyme (inositol monophosphatase family)
MNNMANMLDIANKLANIAGDISRFYFRKKLSSTTKENGSLVTQADLEIESALRGYLSETLPSHGILGEEYDAKASQSEYTWVIDPIDGTSSFACGKPTFCTLIALLKNNSPILGVIDQPITQERWCGVQGEQSRFNNLPCFANTNDTLDLLRLNCTTPLMFTIEQHEKFKHVIKTIKPIVSFGGDGYAYGLLASGLIDIILEADLKFYDVAALIPIIEGAGGCITDWQGNSILLEKFNGTIVATRNKNIHEKILSLIAS